MHLGGCTANPDPAWVTQQARNLAREWLDVEGQVRFLVRDRDSKFTRAFDKVFRSEAVRVLRTPVRAPRANAYAERWIRTVRTECLDWLLILNRTHLERVLRVYVGHYNDHRPHRGLGLDAPQGQRELAAITCAGTGDVYRRVSLPFNHPGCSRGLEGRWAVGGRAHRPSPNEDTDPEQNVAKDRGSEHRAGERRDALAGRGTLSFAKTPSGNAGLRVRLGGLAARGRRTRAAG